MRRKILFYLIYGLICYSMFISSAYAGDDGSPQARADAFLDLYNSLFVGIFNVTEESAWDAQVDVTPEHDGARVASGRALAAFLGDKAVIETARELLNFEKDLRPLTIRQLKMIMLNAAGSPGTIPEVVKKRVEAESKQSSTLDSFQFCLERKGNECVRPVSANDIDDLLLSSNDLQERLRVWEASKEIGPVLKPGLVELQKLRNQVAREMGFNSFFDLQVADYGMTVEEMMEMTAQWVETIRPLYEQLHCWAKHLLADRYGVPVPKKIPAHWIANRWSQNWPGLVESVNLDKYFANKDPEWIVKQAEAFYVSMGFDPLPQSFWDKSDLYPLPPDSKRRKNAHASAWHVNLNDDVRSLMSVQPNTRWFSTSHHELGHIYYYISYTRPEVPPVLREGANRGFHEGIGELISIASLQVPYLKEVGILPADVQIDQIQWLLNEALEQTIAFLPWSAGVMTSWEHDFYEEELEPNQWNHRWWQYVAQFQGIEPPRPRGEEFCDPATKTHINDDPAQYYDYAFATVLKYQLHDHIAREILKTDPYNANYYGSQEVGAFLRDLMAQGHTRDWRELLRETTGEDLSTRAMMEYFEPLMNYLVKVNEDCDCSWE
ncbi:MAG: M2 family metallopeptidase [Candidatus Glassbacteria bacterium]